MLPLVACTAEAPAQEPWQVAPQNQRTATPTHTPTNTPTNTPTPLPTFTPTPVPPTATPVPYVPPRVSAQGSAPQPIATGGCHGHPDRYNWQKYAYLVGFPEWVMPELAVIVRSESGGDLCAVNPSSGATCWIQQHPGGSQFFDPMLCMSQGYSKWLDGGQSFYRHWYAHW